MVSVTINRHSDSDHYGKLLYEILKDRKFNVLVVTVGLSRKANYMRLSLCARTVAALQRCEGGQISIALKPGGSVAWDLNTERVIIHFKPNQDIIIERIMPGNAKKEILCTTNPI